jgi:branched-chain amino acid transport system ATP-binding protein
MSLLEISEMIVRHGSVEAVRRISLSVSRERSLAILGSNGAGKSSAVEAIVGLLAKNGGTVRFAGDDITKLSASSIALRGLALVPQWRELFLELSVEETLAAGMNVGRRRGRKNLKDIYDMFPRLAERRKQVSGTLSGGEQQMLAIGRALAMQPLLLVLDEPTAGLAVGIVGHLVKILQTIRAEGIPLVVVEQNIEVAAALANDCLVLATGRLAWKGTMSEARSSSEVRELYFGK